MGFVRFASETDQQVALIEMDRKKLKGREMNLKLFSVTPWPFEVIRGCQSISEIS